MSPHLEIRLLGELQVFRDGRALGLPRSRKTRALFAYLVATAKPERRERLCDLFFDGPDDPRAALRWSLTKLRDLVDDSGAARIVADRDAVGFESHGATVDLDSLREQLGRTVGDASTDALRAALPLLRGEPLAGLDLADCYAYSAWLASTRDALRRSRAEALRTLARRVANEPNESLALARELLAADPFDDEAHALVIEALNALGRVRDARDAYDECRRVFRRELGREPAAIVDRARTRIEPPPAANGPSSLSWNAASTPCFGRRDEIDALRDMVQRATTGAQTSIVLVTGEPGIGKSRLLEELAALSSAGGGIVLHGRAFEAEMIRPYGPWVDALRPVLTSPLGAAIRAAVDPRLRPALTALVPGGAEVETQATVVDRNHLLVAVVALLGAVGRANPGSVVALDDLHWFDDASLALLHFVARAATTGNAADRIGGVIIALSARPPELAARAAAAALVRAFQREDTLRQFPLGPLSRDEIAALTSRAHAGIDGAQVAAASEGNPLFALEIARNLAAGRTGVPASLEALIDEHLTRLGARARELVTWAAALGASFTPRVLGRVAEANDGELLADLDELERLGIVRQTAGETAYDFSHDLIRRVAYARLSGPRARAVHLAIAQRLAALDDPLSTMAADVAAHALLGGEPALAANACIRAADRCQRIFALVEAQAFAQRGLDVLASAGARSSMTDRDRVVLAVALYSALVHAGGARGRGAEVQQSLERLADEARGLGLNAQMQALFYLVSYIHFHGGNWEQAEADTRRAVAAGRAADDDTAVRSLANSGRCLASIERDLPLAAQLLDEARARSATGGLDVVDVAWGDGILAHYHGDSDRAVEHLERAVALARAREEHWPVSDCLARLASLELERGRYAAARSYCADLASVAAKLGDASERPLSDAIDALAVLGSAEPDAVETLVAAEARLEAALTSLTWLDAKGARSYVLVAAAEWQFARGRVDDAVSRATAALVAAEAVGRRSESAMARAICARAALAKGARADAEALVERLAHDAAMPGALSARALDRLEAVRRALAIPTMIPTPVATPRS